MDNLLHGEIGRIKKMMGLTEDIKFTEMSDDFLDMVKEKTPELYSKFFNLYKNKGIEYAKGEYEKYDPDILDKKQAELEVMWAKKRKEERKEAKRMKFDKLRAYLPKKEEIKDILGKHLLTRNFREKCEEFIIPQLSTNLLTVKESKYGNDILSISYKLNGYLEFRNADEFIDYLRDNGDDKILDNIIKSRKMEKSIKRFAKMDKEYGGFDFIDDFFSKSFRLKTEFVLKLEIREGRYRRENEINFYITQSFKVNSSQFIFRDLEKYDKQFFEIDNKGDVIKELTVMLDKLKMSIMNMMPFERLAPLNEIFK